MGDVAARTQYDEEWFYKVFGIDGEILIDHAWGIEPVSMQDIKAYRSRSNSLSNGQVLPRPYKYSETRTVLSEMIEVLCADMFSKGVISPFFTWWVSYDYRSLEILPGYDGPVSLDFYGRLHPCHSSGTVRTRIPTNSLKLVMQAVLPSFDTKTDHRLLFRRLGICAGDVVPDTQGLQMDFFTDYAQLDRERRIQGAMVDVRKKYGANSLFKGLNLLEGATALERNMQIGGHKA